MADDLFKSKIVAGKPGSGNLFDEELVPNDKPVVCLGMEFPNELARRDYFIAELRKKLHDPEFRKIEGFPIGEDEDILALSDPPYYCACPNPWIGDFIKQWESEKPPKNDFFHYVREPFATDVSEGKNDPIYMLPSYHTKVPPKAIEKYLQHYTEPGDIVIDAFCGTGMTGVAALQMGIKKNHDLHDNYGLRHAILFDLSPIATFTASMMNAPLPSELTSGIEGVLGNIITENILPLYKKKIENGKEYFDYSIWSDWGICPNCSNNFRIYDLVTDFENNTMKAEYQCPHCGSLIKTTDQKKYIVMEFDSWLNATRECVKCTPVLTSHRIGAHAVRVAFTENDLSLYESVASRQVSRTPQKLKYSHMTHERNNLPEYWKITHIHDFFTKRNYYVNDFITSLSAPYYQRKSLLWAMLSVLDNNSTRRNRFYVDRRRPRGSPIGPLSNTLYVPTIQVETNIGHKILQFINEATNVSNLWHTARSLISTQSATQLIQIADNSIDFIFTDPPFGGNINYSEQNVLFEWWINVFTNSTQEAITNTVQRKGVPEYQKIMTQCFSEYYRILKHGHWMVVEFHNSANAIWVAIQQALEVAGFVVATVNVLDKQSSTLHQDHNAAAVDKDLAITVYKANKGLEDRFLREGGTEDGVWDFIRTHLGQLPIFISKNDEVKIIKERQKFLLYDRMVAFHVQRGISVPISAYDFYQGLEQRFPSADEMYFLDEQLVEYRKKRAQNPRIEQLPLFVSDEASARQWLQNLLKKRPMSFQEIHPLYMNELATWNRFEKQIELLDLLGQSFLCYDGNGTVPSQLHAYLSSNWEEYRNLTADDAKLKAKAANRWYVPDPNKAGDLEKVREKALLREFETYRIVTKKLKTFRLEAVRAGFKHAYEERDYKTIIDIAHKIPEVVLEEDPKLLMWYDQAQTRSEE